MAAGALSFWAVFSSITAFTRPDSVRLKDQGWKHSMSVPRASFRKSSTGFAALMPAMPMSAGWLSCLALAVVVTTSAGVSSAWARSKPVAWASDHADMASAVSLSQLPPQAQDVHRRILAGGPFRYAKDGIVFGNRERALPRKPRGFYHEYTVPTPGSRDRGARRIVCGGEVVQIPETCFYTEDHYSSFKPIDPRH
jgi:ribonuclease T1